MPSDQLPVVCLCGSARFKRAFLEAQLEESLAGRLVLSLAVFAGVDGVALTVDERELLAHQHAAKIALADEVLVIDVGGYVGEATAREIATARAAGKPIRYWSAEHPGGLVRRLAPMDVLLDIQEAHSAQGFDGPGRPTTRIPAPNKQFACALIEEETAEFRSAVEGDDLIEIADALADLLYVVGVGAITFGVPLGPVFAEVLRSNFSKIDEHGRVKLRGDGKVEKGPHFSPPDLTGVLARFTDDPDDVQAWTTAHRRFLSARSGRTADPS